MEPQDRFKLVAQTIWDHDPMPHGPPATDEDIQSAELRLGLKFSYSYKLFLKEFGTSSWPDYIYGLGVSSRDSFNVAQHTEDERHLYEPNLQNHLVSFAPDGWGNHYCLDTSQMVDGECPVVFWNHESGTDQVPEVTNATFLDWLEEQVKWELEADEEENSA